MSNKSPTTRPSKTYERISGAEQRHRERWRGTMIHLSKPLVRVPDPLNPTGFSLVVSPRPGKTFRRRK